MCVHTGSDWVVCKKCSKIIDKYTQRWLKSSHDYFTKLKLKEAEAKIDKQQKCIRDLNECLTIAIDLLYELTEKYRAKNRK